MPFDIGFFELCFIAIIALLVLGPERLPTAARTIGRWVSKARRAFTSVKSEIDRELQLDELKQQIKQQQEKMEQLVNNQTMQETLSETQQKINDTRAAFEREMAQQNGSSDTNDPDNKKSEPTGQSNPSGQTQSSDVDNVIDENIDDENEMSGCDNPVEFEPLASKESNVHHNSQTPTIHPPESDARESKKTNNQSQTSDTDESDNLNSDSFNSNKPETDVTKK